MIGTVLEIDSKILNADVTEASLACPSASSIDLQIQHRVIL